MNYGISIWWNTDALNFGFFLFICELQNIKCLHGGFFFLLLHWGVTWSYGHKGLEKYLNEVLLYFPLILLHKTDACPNPNPNLEKNMIWVSKSSFPSWKQTERSWISETYVVKSSLQWGIHNIHYQLLSNSWFTSKHCQAPLTQTPRECQSWWANNQNVSGEKTQKVFEVKRKALIPCIKTLELFYQKILTNSPSMF